MKHEAKFSEEQCERIDEVQNAVFELCKVLTEKEDLEWNMEFIGEIADVACDILVDYGFKVRYPVRITEGSGKQYITDWHNEERAKIQSISMWNTRV